MTTISVSKGFDGYRVRLQAPDREAFRHCLDTLKCVVAPDLREYDPGTDATDPFAVLHLLPSAPA